MDKKNNSAGSEDPFSFVKRKLFGAVSREVQKDDVINEFEEAKVEIENLKTQKKSLQSQWLLMTTIFDDTASIEAELKRIEHERKTLTGEISSGERNVQKFYTAKDVRVKELDATKANLKKILDEKRAVKSGTSGLREQDRETERLGEELSREKEREDEVNNNLEEIEMRLKFVNANVETLVVDSTTAAKALEDLERAVNAKREKIKFDENLVTAIEQVLRGVDDLKSITDKADSSFQSFRGDLDKVKAARKALKNAEDEYNSIPKKIAELSTIGGKDKERDELIEREKSLSSDIEGLKADLKNHLQESQKNKSTFEEVGKVSLKIKQLMIPAGLDEFADQVDSMRPDNLKVEISKKLDDINSAVETNRKNLAQAEANQSQQRNTIARMRGELDTLKQNAQQDKSEVELKREELQGIKAQSAKIQKNLEEKLKKKNTSMSESLAADMEKKQIESQEADAVEMIKLIETDIASMNRNEKKILPRLHDQRKRIEELDGLEDFLKKRLNVLTDLEKLKFIENELFLLQDVTAKYEADLRGFKEIEKEKSLLDLKIAVIEEKDIPVSVMESRFAELGLEKTSLEAELAPLRTEIDFAIEKRDNIEMENSFAREALKMAEERKKSLERKLEFITRESGSVKNIQGKLAACEGRLTSAENSIAEVQTRLNFAAATEDVIKEKFEGSQSTLEEIDKEIESLTTQIEEKEALLPDLRAKISDHEGKLDVGKSNRSEFETNQASFLTDTKKITIECDALANKITDLDATLRDFKNKNSSIEEVIQPYNANLEKQKKLDVEIDRFKSEINKDQSDLNGLGKQVTDLQSKKRALMEESIGATPEPAKEENPNKKKISELREKRKSIRGEIKEVDAKIKAAKDRGSDSDDDKEKMRAEVDALRGERDALHNKIENLNKQMDGLKEGGGAVEDARAEKKEASQGIAQAIGELDIEILTLTKRAEKGESDADLKKRDLAKLTKTRNELVLEIESQKNIIAPLEEIKEKITSIENARKTAQKSLDDDTTQKELLTKKGQEADDSLTNILGDIKTNENALTRIKSESEAIENSMSGRNKELDNKVEEKGRILAEYNRLKSEMSSIIESTSTDREMVEAEKLTAEAARKEVEETKKQLAEAMVILTGKTGSVDSLQLELVSSTAEVSDTRDRIKVLDMEMKSSSAAIDGIETNMEPKLDRLKYIVWAEKAIDEKLMNQKLADQFDETYHELKELKDAKELYDEYQRHLKSKEELADRVGELKGYFELETQLVSAEQSQQEAMSEIKDRDERLEAQRELIDNLEEKYKATTEEKINVKGALDNVTRQFRLATSRWGKIEDLSRIEDSLELKIREFNDKLGAMERVSVKIDRLESEREEFLHQISSLQAKFQASDEEKKLLETSLAQTRAQFENALSLVKESGDEAKKFLYSEA